MSKRKFDFILVENRFYRDILRIYPNNTYIHSFDDNLPETWDDVYKVYYSFAIIRQYFDDNNKNIVDYSDVLLDMYVDECSIIPDLSQFILYVIDTGETYDYPTLGQPAAEWKIEKKTYTIQEVSLNEEIFEFRENYNFQFLTIGLIKDIDFLLIKIPLFYFVIGLIKLMNTYLRKDDLVFKNI